MNDFVHKFLDYTIGNIFGKDITCREPVHRCDNYQPGILTEFGRVGIKFLKKFLMPCGLCAAVPVLRSQSPQDSPDSCNNKKESKMIRPSELPIYPLEDVYSKDIPCSNVYPSSALEQQFGSIRRSLEGVMLQWQVISDTVTSKINTGLEHSQYLVEYLQEEDNTMPRFGAIGIGGLTGIIFGLRGGFLKKLIYTSTGALSVAAICYPKKAEESLEYAKHYANVSYNFIYGVKPGDNERVLPDIKLSNMSTFKMPSTFSELVELSADTGRAIVNVVGSLSERTWELVTDKKEVTTSTLKTDSENKEKVD
ncbi:MICOS complex subunit MIC27 isoform X2 [Vespa velutina]|uniref:MICOS complex subunit MIC27 isoform X2 n=1 Tax=Vespa velutina TaxID=202808 RepID=UPI001FB5621A|nr:MICOS complex subunit MIC27 isoform X2 [Vespa velutina]